MDKKRVSTCQVGARVSASRHHVIYKSDFKIKTSSYNRLLVFK